MRPIAPSYKVQAGIDGEIYPVFANYASLQRQADRTFGVVSVTLSNSTDAAMRRGVTVEIPGWSDREIQTVDLAPGATHTLVFAPAFLPRLYQNHEITAATAHVIIADSADNTKYETTVPVRLRSAEDMFWGNGFKYASFIASWVTPHDRPVEAVWHTLSALLQTIVCRDMKVGRAPHSRSRKPIAKPRPFSLRSSVWAFLMSRVRSRWGTIKASANGCACPV